MQVWNLLHAPHCKYRTQKIVKNLPSGHHRTTLSGYIFANKACIDNWKKRLAAISSTCPHNMVNLDPLVAEIGPVVWGTPANFNGSRILAALLQRRRSTEANQTLHGVWLSPGLVDYIFGGSCPIMEFCQVQHSLCILQVLRSRSLVVLLHGTWAVSASQTLQCWAQSTTSVRQGDHHVGHWPTF